MREHDIYYIKHTFRLQGLWVPMPVASHKQTFRLQGLRIPMPEASHSTNTTLYAVTFIHLALQSEIFNTNRWQTLCKFYLDISCFHLYIVVFLTAIQINLTIWFVKTKFLFISFRHSKVSNLFSIIYVKTIQLKNDSLFSVPPHETEQARSMKWRYKPNDHGVRAELCLHSFVFLTLLKL